MSTDAPDTSPTTSTVAPATAGQHVVAGGGPRLPVWARAVLTPVWFLAALVLVSVLVPLVPGYRDHATHQGWDAVAVRSLACLATLLVALLVLVAVLRLVERDTLRQCGLVWTRHSARFLLVAMGLAAAVQWGTMALGVALGQESRQAVDPNLFGAGAVAQILVLGLAQAFLLQGMPEEIFFRGYLMRVLRAHPRRACWISAGLFAVIHLLSNGGQQGMVDHLLYLLPAFGFGFLAAVLVVRTRSLWSAIGIHGGHHTAVLLATWTGVVVEGRWLWLVSALGYIGLGLWFHRGLSDEELTIDR